VNPPIRTCLSCKKTYQPRPQSDGHGLEIAKYLESSYCSLDCFHEARRRSAALRRATDTRTCEQCGKAYGRNGRKPKPFAESKYCSRECTSKAQQNTDLAEVLQRVDIDPATHCHNWLGQRNVKGYGVTRFKAHTWLVHRLVWEQVHGRDVPEGLQLDHTCNNTSCCNIEHLRVVTPQENSVARNFRRHGGNCPKCGAPYSSAHGLSYCKPCRHERMMAYQRQRRAVKKAPLLAE
jgi:hypothetical protein